MAKDEYLYQEIAEHIRQEILSGKLKSGDRLPSIRAMASRWTCTLGTIQRAYKELSRQGLVTSRAGKGTHVTESKSQNLSAMTTLRRAALIHRAEAFLLEVLTAGYTIEEADMAARQAMDRWRVLEHEQSTPDEKTLRFAGSHDLLVNWIASHISEIAPHYTLQLRFTGSLGGLIALAEGRADIAGSHLWDEESGEFNRPFVQRLFPGKRIALVTLAHRRLGLILPAGNPLNIHGLEDLSRPGLRIANRQPGSGTRVWLDLALRNAGIPTEGIQGYQNELITHSAVARAVAEAQADLGIGLEAAAKGYGLDFSLLTQERYDLVVPATSIELEPIRAIIDWLNGEAARQTIQGLGGYEHQDTGRIEWVG